MALTFAASSTTRTVAGNKRVVRGILTPTGTNTAGGDAISAATLGLHTLEHLGLDLASDGTTAFKARYVKSSGKIKFFGVDAIPGAAVDDPEVTAGTTLTDFAMNFEAVGT